MSASSSVASAKKATTASQDALAKPTLGIVADVSDPSTSAPASAADAESALEQLEAISADFRGGAILASTGKVLAATGEHETWQVAGSALFEAADAAAGEPVSHAHVGTEDGEVFAVRESGFALVAAAERFALSGLMLFDIRSVLRDLARGSVVDHAPPGDAKAEAA